MCTIFQANLKINNYKAQNNKRNIKNLIIVLENKFWNEYICIKLQYLLKKKKKKPDKNHITKLLKIKQKWTWKLRI